MKGLAAVTLMVLAAAGAQQRPAKPELPSRQELSPQEQEDLESALAAAGSSPMEYLRAIEEHLAKYPESPRKAQLERAALRSAMETGDDKRIISYGERVLAREPEDTALLERVSRALLTRDSKESSETALKYALRYEGLVRDMQREHTHDAEWREQTDRAIARALCYEARATGNLGQFQQALTLSARAFDSYPDAETAREKAVWYEHLGRLEDAARSLADAFTIPDPRATDADRARDRAQMGELYRKAKGSEAALGDLVLAAYDRNLVLLQERKLMRRSEVPNLGITDPMEFTLASVEGEKLSMASLKGKVIVLDFWATWCSPCRVQHPLFDSVKRKFHDNSGVVFLSIATDENREDVKPFLKDAKWEGPVYYEDGLSRALNVESIPTTVIIGRDGKVFTRLNGFVPQWYAFRLTERIREALGGK